MGDLRDCPKRVDVRRACPKRQMQVRRRLIMPEATRPSDVRRQPKAYQARLSEAYLDDACMSAAIFRYPCLEAARDDDHAVLGGNHHRRWERRVQVLGERWRNLDLLDRSRRAVVAAAAFLRIPVVSTHVAGNG